MKDPYSKGGPLGVAGEITYSGDVFNAEIAGYLRDIDYNGTFSPGFKRTQSQIGLGLGAKLSDMFDLSVAGSIGNNVFFSHGGYLGGDIGDGWEVSAAVVASLSDSVSAEVGAGYSSYDAEYKGSAYDTNTTAVAGGIYWSPVSQLKTGVQASYTAYDHDVGNDVDVFKAAFVTWWNF